MPLRVRGARSMTLPRWGRFGSTRTWPAGSELLRPETVFPGEPGPSARAVLDQAGHHGDNNEHQEGCHG